MEQQKMHRRRLLFLFGACLATTGCTTLTPQIGDVFSVSGGQADEESKNPELASSPDGPSFVVEMRGTNGESAPRLPYGSGLGVIGT